MRYVSQLFKALADETRLRLVNLISTGEICVCDLTHTLKMPQSTVSRHLAHLKNAGLVTDRRCKTWAYYRLSEGAQPFITEILAVLTQHLMQIDQMKKDLESLKVYKNSAERNC